MEEKREIIYSDISGMLRRGNFDAMIYIEGTSVIAVDSIGNVIARGIAGEDDSAVIQAAIDATPSGTIYIASGDYAILSNLELASNISITGSGPETTLTLAGPAIRLFSGTNLENLTIANLTLVGSGSANTYGIHIGKANTTINIDSVTADNFDVGILITSTTNSRVCNCHCSNCIREGIYLKKESGYPLGSNNLVDNCLVHDCNRYCISIENNDTSTISRCRCYNGVFGALHSESAEGTTWVRMIDNYVENCGSTPIMITGCDHPYVAGNYVKNALDTGINLRRGTVVNNLITGCTKAIRCDAGIIIGNTIVGKGVDAEWSTGIQGGDVIAGNVITNIGGSGSSTRGAIAFVPGQTNNPIICNNWFDNCYTVFASRVDYVGTVSFFGNYIGTHSFMSALPPGEKIRFGNNTGYVTESKGTATLLNTTTAIVVAHGCSVTPTNITVTPGSIGNATKWYVDTIGATNFTIHVDQDPGADITFYWRAEV